MSFVMLVITMNDVMLNVVMLNVVAPKELTEDSFKMKVVEKWKFYQLFLPKTFFFPLLKSSIFVKNVFCSCKNKIFY